MQFVRAAWMVAASSIVLCFALLAQDLTVKVNADQMQFEAPKLHFLTGKPLQQLRDGRAVTFDFHLRILGDDKRTLIRGAFERFVVSYDLWEERFSVARMRSTRASASHLNAKAAEAWCLDKLSVATAGLPNDQPLWVRLEIRAQEPSERRPVEEDETVSLGSLIELFSRATKSQEDSLWRAEAGPIQLRHLRGGRSGS